MSFDTILVANRGEIALRIFMTARQLGYQTVAVYSKADAGAMHVAAADDAVCLGAADSTQSYLCIEKVIAAAKASGAGAIHPGYGFLSENAAFAEACLDAGLVFIGPTPDAIRVMGDKATAKKKMIEAAVPCVPGYHGVDQTAAMLRRKADQIGYPIMIKASAGGGGKGMRLVPDGQSFDEALGLAKAEAMAAFGSDDVLLEKAIVAPRHVEFQVFGDSQGNVIHLGERDCSVQRRHQKVLEESPSPAMTPALRDQMGQAAVAAAKAIDYQGAGTVEFLLDQNGAFYFLEMNTRLQVEHPVTEMVTDTDLVAWQLTVAQGNPLPKTQEDVNMTGWSIEARLYAEDPTQGFLPSVGQILRLDPPGANGVRVDTGVMTGDFVSPHYDPMLAKVIAHGQTRDEARRRLVQALQDMCLFGPKTNRRFLIDALRHPEFVNGTATTDFVAASFPPEHLSQRGIPFRRIAVAAAVLYGYFAQNCRPRLTRPAYYQFGLADERVNVQVHRRPSGLTVRVDQHQFEIKDTGFDGRFWKATLDGIASRGAAHIVDPGEIWLDEKGDVLRLCDLSREGADHSDVKDPGAIRAPMHGRLVEVRASKGEAVTKGQPILVLEAMKMQHVLLAGQDGILNAVHVRPDDQVETGQVLAKISNKLAP